MGGSDSHNASHSHAVDLKTVYSKDDTKMNYNLRQPAANNPQRYHAFVTSHISFDRGNGDSARPKVEGRTAQESLTVATVPRYYQTYYIIRIK
jgi:hypothetical protein